MKKMVVGQNINLIPPRNYNNKVPQNKKNERSTHVRNELLHAVLDFLFVEPVRDRAAS
jgi:hypothetical protein